MVDWAAAAEAARGAAAAWAGDPGGCIVLFDGDGVRAAVAGGLASLEHGVPFGAETPTRLASISKHVLATCLLAEGVELERPLGALAPGLGEAVGAVPLARALDMTGGLPDMMELLWQRGTPFTVSVSRQEIWAALTGVRQLCTPAGAEMAYSNTGWRIGQAVLEARTGGTYAEALARLLPGIASTGIVFPEDETTPVPGLATGYWHDGARWRPGRYGMHFSASGGLVGSGADLGRWGAALLAGRSGAASLLGALTAPRWFADGQASAYRLGLVETRLWGERLVGHSGSLPGYRNHLLMAPDRGVGVVVLMNRDVDPLPVGLGVLAALLGQPAPAPAGGLPLGLYAAAAGPGWAELHEGTIEFMGARETLFAEGRRLRSVPSTLEVDVQVASTGIAGRIGGVKRVLHRVENLPLDPALAGNWREPGSATALTIRADGSARWPWIGGGMEIRLTALPGARALASLPHLMWRHRPCLCLEPDGRLLVASHRARVLRLVRA